MGTSLFTLLVVVVVGLLIIAGVVISVSFYAQGAFAIGRFRRIRRSRSLRPMPDGNVIEETVEEIIDEEVPVEEGS